MNTSARVANVHASQLRSVAASIESLFPDAADLLRGIGRQMDEGLIVTTDQISAAFEAHASADDWGVPSFYEGGLIDALSGKYDDGQRQRTA